MVSFSLGKSAFILSCLRVWVQLKPKFFLSAVDKLDDDGRFLAGDLVNWLDQLFIIWYDHCNILQQALQLLIDCLPKSLIWTLVCHKYLIYSLKRFSSWDEIILDFHCLFKLKVFYLCILQAFLYFQHFFRNLTYFF